MLEVNELLRQLVAIPSVNPMAGTVTGPEVGEARLTAFLVGLLQGLGLEVQRQPVSPGRENLLARYGGANPLCDSGRLVLLGVHQDTVPVTGMSIPPFGAEVREGRLYGRGACDVKGGMAAMIAAVARLAAERPASRATVVLACTVNEECGFDGANALPRLWAESSSFLSRRPDAAVMAEPTELNIVVAHKGLTRWRCHARGRAAHSAYPERGDNAIEKMADVVAALRRYQREVLRAAPSHPLCGGPTLNVGTIQGGVSVNTVPDRCTIEIDRRLSPDEDPHTARQQIIDYLQAELRLGDGLEHDAPFMQGMPLSDEANQTLADQLAGVVRGARVECRKIGVPYATDAASLAHAGVPTVVFGPGSIEQAHTADEWIALDQVHLAAELYFRWCCEAGEL
jgi:acetylornithine deacetylase